MVKSSAINQFLRQYHFEAIKLMLYQVARQFFAPQEFIGQVLIGDLPTWGRAIGSLMSFLLWMGAAVGALYLRRVGNSAAALLVLGILVFFLVAGSISYRVGARLRFPADIVAIPLASIGYSVLRHKINTGKKYLQVFFNQFLFVIIFKF